MSLPRSFALPLAFFQGPFFWILVVLALIGVGLMLPFGLRWLFGPVPFYDLVRVARRRRYYLIRFVYIVGLLVLLFWTYSIWSLSVRYRSSGEITVQDMAQLADQFFYTFMSIQFLVVAVLTPAYTAGAIAEEKDRRTLEFLLATDLRSREIVLGKLVARVANMLLLVLAGLPILSFTQFFGGIDPDLLLAGFAALIVSMLSLAGLSILASTYSRKARDAVVLTYLATAVYLAVSGLAWGSAKAWPEIASFPSTQSWDSPVTLKDLADWINAGNSFIVLVQLIMAYERGGNFADILPSLLGGYVLFHLLMGGLCIFLAVTRLRPVALKETYGRVQRLPLASRLTGRPRIGEHPMLWKELIAEPGMRFNWLGRILVAIVVVVSFLPLIPMWIHFQDQLNNPNRYGYYGYWNDPWNRFGEEINMFVRIVGAIVATLVLLGVAVRGASAISGERDRQTLDGLLTTPLSGHEILFGKWLGCVCSLRFAWLWLAAILAVGIVAGGIHPIALVLVCFAFFVYSVVFAGIGLLFSMRCKTTLRSTLWTLLTVVGVGGGHWLVMGLCCFMPLAITLRGPDQTLEWLAKLELGQTPPVVLGILAFHGHEFEWGGNDFKELMLCCCFGLFCWTIAALGLWVAAGARFNNLTNRSAQFTSALPQYRQSLQTVGPPAVLDAFPIDETPTSDGPPRSPS